MKKTENIFFNIAIIIFVSLFSLCIVTFAFAENPYEADWDHDGFPDEIETETGFNPRINEALVKSREREKGTKCGVIKTDILKIGKPKNVLLILDVSGSMSAPLEGGTRMDMAKKILGKYIDSLPKKMRVGLAIYGARGCGEESVKLLAPIGTVDRESIKSQINGLRPTGATPIDFSIRKAIEYFKPHAEENNNLVLISDGQESCGGNPVEAIKELKAHKVNPIVTIIGLAVDSKTKRQLSQIAVACDGTYADVKSEEDFVKAFESFFKNLSKLYKDVLCIVRQYNSYLTYETQQYNKTKAFLIKKRLSVSGDLKDTLNKLEKELDRKHNERIEVKHKLGKMVKNKEKEMDEAVEAFIKKNTR
ncbi:MAG: VWA domain-containing protein [bacterium]|nr:VWA domain-containing protein [bacterium]